MNQNKMHYTGFDTEHLVYFRSFLPAERVLTDTDHINRCASDETEDLHFAPEVVLQPVEAIEVSRILAYCNQHNLCITPRGAGTGLSGGALPVMGGICLDMRRMNRIISIDTENFLAITEPGVITEELQNAIRDAGLFYPVDPASKGSCFIGGNIAENSGGPRAVKYGVVKDYVLNLEIVLPNGEIINTGSNTLKNATGYNLTQLIVGSEGTLAVITRIVLKLIPYPTESLLLLIPFESAEDACRAVNTIMLAGYTPSALEFMERDALLYAMDYSGSTLSIPDHIRAHLLVEVDGNDKEILFREVEGITRLMEQFKTAEILFAESQEQKQELWKLRRIVGEAVKHNSIYKEEDAVVPRAFLPQLLQTIKHTGNKYGFRSVCYGHAGDGNLHINILKDRLSNEFWEKGLPIAIREIFTYVHSVHGTISGEHGIGYVQRQYMDIVFNNTQLELMRAIKYVFDPKGILNPGKIFLNEG